MRGREFLMKDGLSPSISMTRHRKPPYNPKCFSSTCGTVERRLKSIPMRADHWPIAAV